MKTKNSEIYEAQQISHRKREENYTKTQQNQLLKINDKNKSLNQKDKKKIHIQEPSVSDFTANITKEEKV